MYNAQMLEKLGEVYHSLLYVMNKKGNDPYQSVCAIMPLKYFTIVHMQAIRCGNIPESLTQKISDALADVTTDDMENMEKPCPVNLQSNWWIGYMRGEKH